MPLITLAQARAAARPMQDPKELSAIAVLVQRVRALIAARPPLTPKDLAIDGAEIMNLLSIGPSPVIGAASRFLMQQVLEDPTQNTPDKLRELVTRWARTKGS
jgi:tRNA nucleotidyltransferase (CCA-adding enzyme)